jgi:UDP-N-acetylmuramate dehydrogenase
VVRAPADDRELQEALAFAAREGVVATVVGLGSNLLAADEGVDALVLRLGGELAAVTVADDRVTAGGGATNAVVLHRARDAGLGGFEFACAIPGTTGGGVWMNAGACGGDRSARASARRDGRRGAAQPRLGSHAVTRTRDGQVGTGWPRLAPLEEIKTAIAQFQSQRKAAQPTNKRTFGSVFENPRHELSAGRMLEACGLKGHRIGGAQISPMHANFIENAGGARSADAVALMTEARRRRTPFVDLRRSSLSACRSAAADVGALPAVAKFAA